MPVLVAYASRHGATRGIAERIAARIAAAGLQVEVVAARDVRHVERYDAFVVGSAAYMFRWLGDASKLVARNHATLAARPTWLFTSGPVGPDEPDAQGRDPRITCIPRGMPELAASLHARDHHVFFGAWDTAARPIGLMERITRLMPAARNAMPNGDFRDWPEIDAWADDIADALGAGRAVRGQPRATTGTVS